MINRRVVLVLGAGASQPYGFPIGSELKAAVLDLRNHQSSHPFRTSFGPNQYDDNHFNDFVSELAKAPFDSVDAFLEARQEFLDIGKHTIAFVLIQKENFGDLLTPAVDKLGNWYKYILNLMLSQGLDRLQSNKLSIVTFNYDRSFQYYLIMSLMAAYSLTFDQAASKLKFLNFISVHGQLGSLIEKGASDAGRDYQPVTDSQRVSIAANGIKIISELSENPDNPDWSGFRLAWQTLEYAESIVFLGFGYNKTNISRLFRQHWTIEDGFLPAKVTGTTRRITSSEVNIQVIPSFQEQRITFGRFSDSDCTSLDFIRNHLDIFVKPR